MAKMSSGKSDIVKIPNVSAKLVDDVKGTKPQIGISFRNNDSKTGWAKAYIKKDGSLRMESNNNGMYTVELNEKEHVNVRFYDESQPAPGLRTKRYHTEEMPARDFKKLFNESRGLAKSDKATMKENEKENVTRDDTSSRGNELDEFVSLPQDLWDEHLPF